MKIRKKLLFSFMMLGLLAACGENKENTANATNFLKYLKVKH